MKVKIGDHIFDPDNEPIALIFEDDNDRAIVASHLSNMEPKEGRRIYVQYPDRTDVDIINQFVCGIK